MKTQIIAISALGAFFTSGLCAAGSFEDHFGGQEGVNAHFQGTDHRLEDRIDHLQRSDTNNNAWDARQQAQIDNNTAWNDRQEGVIRGMQGDIKANTEWNDRQEGVIRQNRGRLDENDARNQRQDDSIDNAHARIGGVKQQADSDREVINSNTDRSIGNQQAIGFMQETDAQLSSAIDETNNQLAVTDNRTIQNARANAATQARVEDVNGQSIRRDKELGGRLDQQAQRDDALAAESGRIESESVQRDTVIANQVDYNEQVNAAYRRQSAAQFEQHDAAIQSNTQAIANERNERQQMGKDLNAGVAGALAAAAAQFDLSYYGAQLSVSGGSYRGESAAGLSVGAKVNDYVFINGGVVHDSRGHQGLNAAVNWKL